tara:strand:- start:63 stop:299 length:237 start_codon:yes stop_codon:yes gene_type:complete
MLYQEKKSFFSKEFNSNDIAWCLIWGVTVFGLIAAVKDTGKEFWPETGRNFLLWGIFLMLGMIFDTLRQILKKSNRGL